MNSKKLRYERLIPQVKALIDRDADIFANLSNIMAALKYEMNFFWVGCYFVRGNRLELGPFQGPVACTSIGKGKGVCGKAWEDKKTVIVKNTHEFPGHIACNPASKSEIVLTAFGTNGEVALVLDVDSDVLADFNKEDEKYLQQIVRIIETLINE